MTTPLPLLPVLTDALVRRYDAAGPRYTSYPTAPEWTSRFGPEEYGERLARASARVEEPLSLYVHLPFCAEMCAYCGCNVAVSHSTSFTDIYLDHLERELDLAARALGERRNVAQMHWGGGTPTFLTEAQLSRLFAMLSSRFRFLPSAELAVELDPAVTTGAQLRLLRSFGFNRLSLGVQDFDPAVQRAIRRIQPSDETAAFLAEARALGFGAVNFDLIYGLPLQTPETWRRTLERVIAMRPDRLAVYSFAYLPRLKPNQRVIRADDLPTGPEKLRLFIQAWESFVGAGYRSIGMDHFALPEDELARAQATRSLSRNFQGYTVSRATETLALGVTGIGDIEGAFAQNVRPLARYYAAVNQGRFPIERGFALSEDDRRRRALITQLMCNFWADLGTDGRFDAERARLALLEEDGLLTLTGNELEVTPLGRLFVRNIAMIFDTYLRQPGRETTYSRTV